MSWFIIYESWRQEPLVIDVIILSLITGTVALGDGNSRFNGF